MTRDVACPKCRRMLRVASGSGGPDFKCPLCNAVFGDAEALPSRSTGNAGAEIAIQAAKESPSPPAPATGHFKAPQATPISLRPTKPRLNSPWQVTLAFVLGGLPGGFGVMAINFFAL